MYSGRISLTCNISIFSPSDVFAKISITKSGVHFEFLADFCVCLLALCLLPVYLIESRFLSDILKYCFNVSHRQNIPVTMVKSFFCLGKKCSCLIAFYRTFSFKNKEYPLNAYSKFMFLSFSYYSLSFRLSTVCYPSRFK